MTKQQEGNLLTDEQIKKIFGARGFINLLSQEQIEKRLLEGIHEVLNKERHLIREATLKEVGEWLRDFMKNHSQFDFATMERIVDHDMILDARDKLLAGKLPATLTGKKEK